MEYKEIIKYKRKISDAKNNNEIVDILNGEKLDNIVEILKFCEIDFNTSVFDELLSGSGIGVLEKYKISSKIYGDLKEILEKESFIVSELDKKKVINGIELMLHFHFIFWNIVAMKMRQMQE